MNLGSYRPGESVHLLFTTVDAAGAPTALVEESAGPAVDVRVNSTATPVDSENVTADFDAVVGLNQVVVDTTGYVLGDYTVTISDGAVDGVSVVGYVVGRFRVESQGVLASGTAQSGAGDSITLASGESSTNDIYTGGVVEIAAGTGAGQTPRVITDYVGATKVATIEPNWVVTPDGTSVYRVYSVPPSAGIGEAMGVGLTLYGAATSDDVAAADQNIQNILGTPASADMSADIAANLAAINAIDFDAEGVADAVWDELLTEHEDVGSTGAALAAAGSAGDPWATPLPGSYGAGTAGQIVGDNLDVAVGTVASAILSEIGDLNDLSVADVLAQVSAGLTAYGAATGADVSAAQAAIEAALGDLNDLSGAEVADALLGRSIAGGADGGRTVSSALRRLRNRVAIAAGTLTVYAEDDSTPAHTAVVTTTPSNPISQTNPSG